MKSPKSYFTNFWNYQDILGLIFVLVTTILDWTIKSSRIKRPFFAVALLLLFSRNQYNLRIFRSIGYLTNMVKQVISDMRPFLLLISSSIAAFGTAFYMISQN